MFETALLPSSGDGIDKQKGVSATTFPIRVGGRSGSYVEALRQAKETALREMQENAHMMDVNAVIGVDLDYETAGGSGSMLMVTACGTAVTIE